MQVVDGRMARVHRIAAVLWLGLDPDSPLDVLHACDNKKCFHPLHLFLGTNWENALDRAMKCYSRINKLSPPEVREIRSRRKQGERIIDIAPAFGVAPETVSSIIHGHNWRWVED